MNPFDLRGPDFLLLYLVVCAVAVGIALVARKRMGAPEEPRALSPDLDHYRAAYLAGRGPRAFASAIYNLVHRRLLVYDLGTQRFFASGDLPPEAPDLEKAVHGGASGAVGATVEALRDSAAPAIEGLRRSLEGLALVFRRGFTWPPALICLSAVLFGCIKVAVGLSRDRPVGFLVILIVLMTLLALALGGADRHRTPAGDGALQFLIERNAALPLTAKRRPESVSASDLALAVGLFGLGIAAAGPYSGLKQQLKAAPPSSSSSSGCSVGSLSGCGGGGGGCGGGGGGCGGGGCGGCGS